MVGYVGASTDAPCRILGNVVEPFRKRCRRKSGYKGPEKVRQGLLEGNRRAVKGAFGMAV